MFKDPDIDQEKQALACLIILQSSFLYFLRVFINYLEGLTKWSRGPYTARRSEVPHPCSRGTKYKYEPENGYNRALLIHQMYLLQNVIVVFLFSMLTESNSNLFLLFSTRDMSTSPTTLCPWWICGDFLLKRKEPRTLIDCFIKPQTFYWRKHHLFTGQYWANTGHDLTIYMDFKKRGNDLMNSTNNCTFQSNNYHPLNWPTLHPPCCFSLCALLPNCSTLVFVINKNVCLSVSGNQTFVSWLSSKFDSARQIKCQGRQH